MPRFILIDPPLVDTVGHHHEFAHNVLTAAAEQGYSGVLAGHRLCQIDQCGGWPVRAAYRDGLWTHQAGHAGLRALSYAVSALRRGGRPAEPLASAVQRRRDAWRARRFADDTRRLLTELAAAPDDLVFVPNATITEVLGVTRLLRAWVPARRPSWGLEFHFNIFAGGRVPLVDGEFLRLQAAVRDLRAAAADARVSLSTDTEELTAQYESLDAGPFGTLPIPVDPVYRPPSDSALKKGDRHLAALCSQPEDCLTAEPVPVFQPSVLERPDSNAPLQVAYIGDARVEKGYPLLPTMIEDVWDDLVANGRVRFVIQSNCRAARSERPALAARDKLAALAARPARGAPPVELLARPLSTAEYRALVLASDVILLPYDPRAYAARSSGILSEALSAGKPVIAPEGTWMAGQIRSAAPLTVGAVHPAGPAGMAAALRHVARTYERCRADARTFAAAWAQCHNPRQLVTQLTQFAAVVSPQFTLRRTG